MKPSGEGEAFNFLILNFRSMAFIDTILKPPAYGWADEQGELVKPTAGQLFSEFFSRINVFKSRKNWLAMLSWLWLLLLTPFLYLFIFKYFTLPLLLIGFVYSMVLMGTHGTIWFHRYCTHQAYIFTNGFWRFITQNLVIKMVPEEIYVVSHHVHHTKSDEPGDPYNAQGGFLYCFLADVNHQPIAQDLSEKDYASAVGLMEHTGVVCNSYAQYQKWGSIASPLYTVTSWILNWAFWYGAFFLIGGHALACTIFASALIWAFGVRTFNYEGHGKGKDKRQEGIDFDRRNMSINQYWPGIVAGEWHNNHHLFPRSARSGFLKHQIDFAWYYIYLLYLIGGVKSYQCGKNQFFENYYIPYQKAHKG